MVVFLERLLAATAANREWASLQPRGQDRLVAVDAASVGAGLQELQRHLDLADLPGVHLDEGDVEPDLKLLGGALLRRR
jgi:hypothetical protein